MFTLFLDLIWTPWDRLVMSGALWVIPAVLIVAAAVVAAVVIRRRRKNKEE